jgi:secondary thiamine-phosphate synthase enzyme
MNQAVHTITVATEGAGLTDITPQIRSFVANNQVQTGLLTVFCRHTSASLVIQENADPDVLRDLQSFFRKIVPEGAGYRHDDEGPDDMPGHIKSALTQASLSIPIANGRMVLGTWQAIYLFEHRAIPHRREVVLHLIG